MAPSLHDYNLKRRAEFALWIRGKWSNPYCWQCSELGGIPPISGYTYCRGPAGLMVSEDELPDFWHPSIELTGLLRRAVLIDCSSVDGIVVDDIATIFRGAIHRFHCKLGNANGRIYPHLKFEESYPCQFQE